MRLLWLLMLLVLVGTASAQYKSETLFAIKRPTDTTAAPWVTVSGDSGSVAACYPCENGALADSAGRRVDLTWEYGGWKAEVDTTGDYSVFYRTGCCAETLDVRLQCRRLWGPILPSAMINIEALSIVSGASVDMSATGGFPDTTTVSADTLRANMVDALSALAVAAGHPGPNIANASHWFDDGEYHSQVRIGTDANAIIADSLLLGDDLVAADSTKSPLRLYMWPEELPDQAWKTITQTTGSTAQTFKWIGIESWDCIICSAKANASSLTATDMVFDYTYSNGNITIDRPIGATGNLTIICRWARGGD